MGDLHKILQVRPGADDETIAAAYARLRRRYDPALGGPFADEAALREVERAYAVLSDPRARDDYEMSRLGDDGAGPLRSAASLPPATGQSPAARDPFGLDERKRPGGPAESPPTATPSQPAPEQAQNQDIWRGKPAPQSMDPPAPDEQLSDRTKVSYSPPTLPNRRKDLKQAANDSGQPGIWNIERWRGIGVVPVAAVIFVIVGAGLAGWGIVQAIGNADDDAEPQVASPQAEQGTPTEDSAPASDTLAPPEVTSSNALPIELADFAGDVIAEAEEGGYRVYDFVATLTDSGSVFYAAIAIAEGSELVGQKVFFFVDQELIGSDWEDPVRSIESIASVAGGQIRVVYRVYAEDDEDCCPSGQPFPVVFSYDNEFSTDSSGPPAGIFVE